MGGDTEEIYGLRVCAPAPSSESIRELSTPIIIIQFITASQPAQPGWIPDQPIQPGSIAFQWPLPVVYTSSWNRKKSQLSNPYVRDQPISQLKGMVKLLGLAAKRG